MNSENPKGNRTTRIVIGLIVPILIVGFWYYSDYSMTGESDEVVTTTSRERSERISGAGQFIGLSGEKADSIVGTEFQSQKNQEVIDVIGFIHDQQAVPLVDQKVNLSSSNGERDYTAVSHEDGKFTLSRVIRLDSYKVWVEPDGLYNDYAKTAVTFGPENEQLDIELKPMEAGRLSGQLTDSLGDGVPYESLLMTSKVSRLRTQAITSDSNGYFYVENFPLGPVGFETHSGTHYRIEGVELTTGNDGDIKLVLDNGDHRLEGSVMGSDGNVIVGAVVTLDWMHNREGVISRARRVLITDITGTFNFDDLGPGARQLSVYAGGFQPYKEEIEETVSWFAAHLSPIGNQRTSK